MLIGYVTIWILTLLALLIAIGTYGEFRHLENHKHAATELPVDSRAPLFRAQEAASAETFDSVALRGTNHILLFISPGCGLCHALLAEVPASTPVPILAICHGDQEPCATFSSTGMKLLLDPQGAIADKYGVLGSPMAVAINDRHRIRGYSSGKHYADLSGLMEQFEAPAIAGTAPVHTQQTTA